MAIFSSMPPGASERFTFDFDRELGDGETIQTGTASIAVLDGADASASSLVGAVVVMQSQNGGQARALGVMVTIPSGTTRIGNRYGLTATATTTAGQTIPLAGDFEVLAPIQ